MLVPAGVALGPEEDRPLVVVDAVDGIAQLPREIDADLGADQSGRAGDKEGFGHEALSSGWEWAGCQWKI